MADFITATTEDRQRRVQQYLRGPLYTETCSDCGGASEGCVTCLWTGKVQRFQTTTGGHQPLPRGSSRGVHKGGSSR